MQEALPPPMKPRVHAAMQLGLVGIGLVGYLVHRHVYWKVARSEIDNSNYSIENVFFVNGMYTLTAFGALGTAMWCAKHKRKPSVSVGWLVAAIAFGVMSALIFTDLARYVSAV